MLLTFSRGAYVGFTIGFLWLGIVGNRKFLAVAVLIGALLLADPTRLVPNAVVERVQMTQSEGQLDHSAATRVDMWETALTYFQQDPLAGVGFDTFRFVTNDLELHDTHNFYVRVLYEGGVIGILILAILLIKAFRISASLLHASDPFVRSLGLGASASMLCLAVVNFFGDRFSYIEISGFTFLILGMVERANAFTDTERDADIASAAVTNGILSTAQ
jgi:O-antigen ligase